MRTVIGLSKGKQVYGGRYGKARICRKCKKIILRDEPYIGKYHEKCYNSTLIGN